MPEMNGRELAEEISAGRPGIKVLFMSGYTADVIARQGIVEKGFSFIQKPFSMKDIAVKISSVLEK
jgi:DNA-binding NtrC family response regulator